MRGLLKKGTIKRLHVDRRIIAQNAKTGQTKAAVTIQTSHGSYKVNHAEIRGVSKMIYRPNKPLACGARVWVETRAEVAYS